MSLDFGVTNSVYLKALEEMRKTQVPEEHFKEVIKMIDNLEIQFEQERKDQIVSFEEMNKVFTI